MNYDKYDTICCKRCFHLLICNELSGKSITKDNKYNEYKYNPTAVKFQFIFAWLLFTVYI